MTEDRISPFFKRMDVVLEDSREGIAKDRLSFLEGHSMLLQVCRRFGVVPLKGHNADDSRLF
jgi:hypothetical protein